MELIRENVELKPFTYFKIGGPARYFAEVINKTELEQAVRFAKARDLPICVLGAASNILVADGGFCGLVIRLMLRGIRIDESKVYAEAGVPNAVLVARLVSAGLAGFEWAIGIPGTVGGSVRGNAGCFGGEMKDVVRSVYFFNTDTGEFDEQNSKFCEFGYRDSIFKHAPNLIITEVDLELERGNPEVSQRRVRYYTRHRSEAQDIGSASAGCIFKNPTWPADEQIRARLLRFFPDLADFDNRKTIPAAFLIDRLGLKGKRIGAVSISEKHANYLINNGGANAESVVMLIGLVKEYVHRKFDLQLEEEIQYVGFD